MAKKKGMDICYHQGDIDFAKAKAAGISFIIPRDGWGTDHLDPKLVEYAKQAKAAGVDVPGVYHFIYGIDSKEAIQNAQQAIENVKAAGLPQSTIIWCDIEYDTVDNARDYRKVNLSNKDLRNMAESFCNYCLAEGYPTGIYANRDYIQNVYGADIINEYDIWLADLEGGADYQCVYRQTDWYAYINGVVGNVDIDEYYGQYTAGTAKVKTETVTKEDNEVAASGITTFINALPTIEKGSKGEVVKLLQKCLAQLGFYADSIDGSAGNNTYKAIIAFEKANGIGQDGRFGQKCWTKLLKG